MKPNLQFLRFIEGLYTTDLLVEEGPPPAQQQQPQQQPEAPAQGGPPKGQTDPTLPNDDEFDGKGEDYLNDTEEMFLTNIALKGWKMAVRYMPDDDPVKDTVTSVLINETPNMSMKNLIELLKQLDEVTELGIAGNNIKDDIEGVEGIKV